MVHAQANRRVVLAAHGDERQQGLADAAQLGGVLLIGVFQLLEGACRVHKVARIDAHTLAHLGCGECCLWIEVDVGNQGDVAAIAAQQLRNLADAAGLFHTLGRQPHIVGSGIGNALALGSARLDIIGGSVGHRLDAYGPIASHGDSTHIDAHCRTAFIVEEHILV